MTPAKAIGRKLKPEKIKNVVSSLTPINIDVSKLAERLKGGTQIGGGDAGACVIDISCCIIDCSKCAPNDIDIYTDPANEMGGLIFRLPEEAKNHQAPVYYVPQMSARTAFRMSHGSLKVPGGKVKARLVGVAGDVFSKSMLTKNGIAPTASVIALTPARG